MSSSTVERERDQKVHEVDREKKGAMVANRYSFFNLHKMKLSFNKK